MMLMTTVIMVMTGVIMMEMMAPCNLPIAHRVTAECWLASYVLLTITFTSKTDQ